MRLGFKEGTVIKELKCKNCGASLTKIENGFEINYKCEYCGTLYNTENKNNVIQFTTINSPPSQTLSSCIRISDWTKENNNIEDISQFTIEQLSMSLAKGLAAYMRIDTEKDPFEKATIIRGTVRVIPPDFRY